jgi:hypothetical protein
MTVAESLVAAGSAVRSQIAWAKDRLVLSRGDYHWQQFTGANAVLAETGETFADLKAKRLAV